MVGGLWTQKKTAAGGTVAHVRNMGQTRKWFLHVHSALLLCGSRKHTESVVSVWAVFQLYLVLTPCVCVCVLCSSSTLYKTLCGYVCCVLDISCIRHHVSVCLVFKLYLVLALCRCVCCLLAVHYVSVCCLLAVPCTNTMWVWVLSSSCTCIDTI